MENGGFRRLPDCEPLEGEARGRPRARRVFHAILVKKLEMDGALTVKELQGRLHWFKLKLNDLEVDQLVASAARHQVIEPLTDPNPTPEDEETDTRWVATDRGRQIPYPTGASFEDLGTHAPSVFARLTGSFSAWSALALTFVAALGAGAITADKTLAAAFVIFAFVALVCFAGVQAERDLKAAGAAWPRFQKRYPLRWKWQALPGRSEVVTAGALIALAFVLAAWVAHPDEDASRNLALVAAAVGVATLLLHLLRLAPLSREWRAESKVRSRWAQRRSRLIKKLASLRKLSWILKRP